LQEDCPTETGDSVSVLPFMIDESTTWDSGDLNWAGEAATVEPAGLPLALQRLLHGLFSLLL